MTAFETQGGYGIFERYLERSLLWKRSERNHFAPIDYPPGKAVPSWSWMAYDGLISYLDVPFDEVNWSKDYESPFAQNGENKKIFWEANGTDPIPSLKSEKARRLVPNRDEPCQMFFDQAGPEPCHTHQYKCIVLGKKKKKKGESLLLETGTRNYVLIIKPVDEPSSAHPVGLYRRAGVGSLPDCWIDWESTERVEVH